ncbi:hypothetical protein BKA70DRAFT_1252653 [Coprinopsis sp. MPI-PUGE-AT-0042]|nr:hypothetical protein BKA70DRAFT_1252653 [Coprinopsis sp. MPI-PUGE-AT-0042]
MDRLPPELLAKILMFVRHAYADGSHKPMAWTFVTEVCRFWHEVALGYPVLWSNIAVENDCTAWVPIMLERSVEVPLDLDLRRGWTRNEVRVVEALAPHLARVRTFRVHTNVYVPVGGGIKALIMGMTRPAPLLEKLTLIESPGHISPPLKILPFDFLAGIAPRLRSLTFITWKLSSWNSPLLGRTLTDLNLSFKDVKPPAIQVLDALERMVNLETLWLRVPLPDCDPPSAVQLHKVKLCRLRKLSLSSVTMGQIVWLLQHVSIPVSATLELHCIVEVSAQPSIFRSFTSALRTSWLEDPLRTTASPPSFKHLDISFGGPLVDPLIIQGWFNYSPENIHGPSDLNLCIRENRAKASLSTIIDTLSADNVKSLCLSANLAPDELASLTRLQGLESIHCGIANGFVEYLTSAPTHPNEGSPFPNLKHLSFSGQDFTGEYLGVSRRLGVDRLVECLARRKEGGREILSVKLVSCFNFFKDDVRKIEGVCREVIWDGQERKRVNLEDFICGTESDSELDDNVGV